MARVPYCMKIANFLDNTERKGNTLFSLKCHVQTIAMHASWFSSFLPVSKPPTKLFKILFASIIYLPLPSPLWVRQMGVKTSCPISLSRECGGGDGAFFISLPISFAINCISSSPSQYRSLSQLTNKLNYRGSAPNNLARAPYCMKIANFLANIERKRKYTFYMKTMFR